MVTQKHLFKQQKKIKDINKTSFSTIKIKQITFITIYQNCTSVVIMVMNNNIFPKFK